MKQLSTERLLRELALIVLELARELERHARKDEHASLAELERVRKRAEDLLSEEFY